MIAETPKSAQQNAIGVSSAVASTGSAGVTVSGTVGGAGSGIVTSGCVFFICTAGPAAGFAGRTAIRAVSFLGPGIGGFGINGAAGGGAVEAPDGGGAGVVGREKGGGVTALAGAGGKGVCARGGRGGGAG